MIRLTEWTSCGGCAAKWGAAPLSALVRELASNADPALLVGLAPFDDAAVYKVTDDLAVVSTTDFFPPLVDDPADFGAIAAANACSDVFAMGGRVVMALNISAFPERMPVEAIGGDPVGRGRSRARGGRRGRRRPHHPVRGADLRPRGAGPRAPRPDLHEGRRTARRRARAVEAARHGHRARRRHARAEGGRHHADAHAEPGGVRGAVRDGRGGARRHRRDRLRAGRSRLGDGRALGFAARVRCGRAFRSTTAPSRPPRPGTRTGGDARNREHLADRVAVDRWRRRSRRSASTRRRRAACSLRSRRRRHRRAEAAGFTVIGEVVAGPAGVTLARHDAHAAHRRSGWSSELWEAGHDVVVGVDEVGRGAWAGPLVGRRRGAAARPAGLQGARLEDAHRGRAGEALLADRLVVRHVGGRSRDAGGVRRARHVRRAAPRGPARDRGARRRSRCDRRRRQLGLRLAGGADGEGASHGQGRRDVPVGLGGVDARQGHARPHDAGRGRALPRLRLRREQGLPVPAAQGGAAAWGPTSIHRRTWVFMDHLPWPGMRVLRPEQAQLFEA